MDYSFFDFLRLIGSLALFLYGMKIMSEGLQKFAGDSLRRILTAMTTNRVTGMLTGVLITALIQSSSATTVMVVSFVNAGLLTLTQSIGVIMGANIGTTVTAWLISALGFKVDIAAFALPLLAFALPLFFSGKSSRKSIGEFVFGFAFLFMGLQSLKANAPDLGANPEMLAFVQNYTDMGFFSIILFLFIGAILTMIVQASAATMAITLIMCANGWIDYHLGVALVLGENIGNKSSGVRCIGLPHFLPKIQYLRTQRTAGSRCPAREWSNAAPCCAGKRKNYGHRSENRLSHVCRRRKAGEYPDHHLYPRCGKGNEGAFHKEVCPGTDTGILHYQQLLPVRHQYLCEREVHSCTKAGAEQREHRPCYCG